MGSDEEEEAELRAVALENARTILRARQRAERELIATKEALERKSRELAGSLAMMQATLESTFDGILVTNGDRKVTGFNEKYLKMWNLPREHINAADHTQLLEVCAPLCADPKQYLSRIEEIYSTSPPHTADILNFTDGRIYERFSTIQYLEGQNVGRVWSFRDVTERKQAEEGIEQTLSLLKATVEASGDGILVVDNEGRIVSFNRKFVEMWHIPDDVMAARDDKEAMAFVLDQLRDPERFVQKVQALYAQPEAKSYDWLDFKDGRMFERYSSPQKIGGTTVGRVWSRRRSSTSIRFFTPAPKMA
jgi:PAS domain-containing protein